MSRLVPIVAATVFAASLPAQGQTIQFYFAGTASGLTTHQTPSGFLLRAGSLTASHVVSVPLAAGMQEAQLAPPLVAAAAQQQIVITPVVGGGVTSAFLLASVDGAAPARGCLFGTDDTGIAQFVGTISGGGTTRFFGCAFPKAVAGTGSSGTFSIEVVGPSTTDGHLFGAFTQVQVAAGDTATAINTRIHDALVAKGCHVFDIAIPSFASAAVTAPGFGIDRFDGLVGAQVGHQFRVSQILIAWSGAAATMPKVAGLGWFPTGGFAEYGTGFTGNGPEPYVRGDGSFAPGGSYQVALEYGRHAVGLLAIANGRAATALPGGGTLLLDPATILGLVPFHTDARGRAVHTVATPADPALVGQTLHYQGLGVHAGGLAVTSGLYCRIWQ